MSDEWSEQRIAMLRQLWGEGLSAKRCADAINRAFGTLFSRNAIMGRAHRLKLAGRPSPIKADAESVEASRRMARERRRNGDSAPKREPAKLTKNQRAASVMNPVRTVAPSNVNPVTMGAPRTTSSRDSCAWPEGDPRDAGFHFCAAQPVVPGKPYCLEHCRRAYRSQEQAAAERAAA